ncbi:anti-phage protein KwaA [Vibrio splendidus]|uniref:anti-phage protein KwaA n=1 Tax=Vibrio splendidus TaxID=29497 RepID=UPI000E08FB32|nr:anti-phage protein KwaA [Vibrio splendidus]
MNTKEKVKLYILSLGILFPIILIMSLKMPSESFQVCGTEPCNFEKIVSISLSNIWLMYKTNWLAVLMLFCFLGSLIIKRQFEYMLEGGVGKTVRVCNVKSEDYEHLTFLATYIIPFFGFSFDDPKKLIAYLILIIIIGMIFIKTDKYYANPTLALFGYRLYKADLSDSHGLYESVIIISTDKIINKQSIKYKLISDNVFFAKVVK